MLGLLAWLYEKLNCKVFKEAIQKKKKKWAAENGEKCIFFKILNEIAFLNPNNLKKRQREWLQTFFYSSFR